jgi:hypothetical protein
MMTGAYDAGASREIAMPYATARDLKRRYDGDAGNGCPITFLD